MGQCVMDPCATFVGDMAWGVILDGMAQVSSGTCLRCVLKCAADSLLVGRDLHVGEIGLGVGFGPKTDEAGFGERIVGHVDEQLAVEVTLDAVAFVNDADRLPFAGLAGGV